ncbi:MAG: SPFH domain-containing protein [Planctomycetota bacterium]
MATITKLAGLRHLRAEATQHILHFRRGRLVRSGPGLAYLFHPIAAAVAEIPVSDLVVDVAFRERSSDFQELIVHASITYRIADPETAATRIDFGINMKTGRWLEDPIERLATIWRERAQDAARAVIAAAPVVSLLEAGTDPIRDAITNTLHTAQDLPAMGLEFVAVQVVSLAPSSELEKALGTPARESLQEKADEALFQRRALAVENERAIAENELRSEIELARRREELITHEGDNRLLEVRQEAEAKRQAAQAKLEREELAARSYAEQTATRAAADTEAEKLALAVKAEAELRHFNIYENASAQLLLGLALREFAGSIEQIHHLNLSPNLLSDALLGLLGEEANQ